MNTENRSNRIVSTLVTVATVMTVQIRAATLYVSQTSPILRRRIPHRIPRRIQFRRLSIPQTTGTQFWSSPEITF
jgi:hypothetical protein